MYLTCVGSDVADTAPLFSFDVVGPAIFDPILCILFEGDATPLAPARDMIQWS